MAKRKSSGGRRRQTDPFIKAAAHPTRQTILRSLKERKRLSTMELEKLTGESRYNLYHHLAQLEDAELIDYELEDSRAKQYYLKGGEHSLERFVYLETGDDGASAAITDILKLLESTTTSALPEPKAVESISLIIRLRKG